MQRETRERIFTRAGGYCERCGGGMVFETFAAHHRLLRSQGGTDSLSNLMAVHHSCHNGDTKAIHAQPHTAYNEGWLVRGGHDPRLTSMRLPGGTQVLLRDDGLYEYPCMECDRVYPLEFMAKNCVRADKSRDDDHEEDGDADDH